MSQTYTEGFTIPTSGLTGGCSALLNATATTATAVVVPWRSTSGGTCNISLSPGTILPMKVRRVVSSTQELTGLN